MNGQGEYRPEAPWSLSFFLITQALPVASVRFAGLALIGLYVLGRIVMRQHLAQTVRVVPPTLWVFIAFALVSFAWSLEPRSTVFAWLQLVSVVFIIAYYIAAFSAHAIHMAVGLGLGGIVALSVVAESLDGVLLQLSKRDPALVQGILANPNLLAFVCVATVITVLTLRPIGVLGVSVCVMAIILLFGTSSAGGLLYFLGALGAFALVALRSRVGLRITLGVVGLVVVVSLYSFNWVYNFADSLTGVSGNTTLTGRTVIWEAAWSAWREELLLGYGLDALRAPHSEFGSEVLWLWGVYDFDRFNAHNGLLDVGLQLGVLGMALIVGTVLSAGYRYVRALGFNAQPSMKWGATLLILICLYNLTETRLLVPPVAWILLCVSVSLHFRRISRY